MTKIKVTQFKTDRINAFTGGKIEDYQVRDYPAESQSDGLLPNSFISKNGTYMGDYNRGWWYFKNQLLVCDDYPHGVAIQLHQPANKLENLDNYMRDGLVSADDIKGYYGYTHRGGCLFKIGDRLFEEKYDPNPEDYEKDQWNEWLAQQAKSIKKQVDEGYSEDEAKMDSPISDYIPFRMRGTRIIKTWDEAKKGAINLSKYLG